MKLSEVAADIQVKRSLVQMADSGRLGHAIMLHEDQGAGGLALAVALSQYLLCDHPSGGDSCGVCDSCRKVSRLIHPDVHFAFPVNTGSKSGSDRKPVSDTYLKEWRELFLSDAYFGEHKLYEALGMETKTGIISVAEAKRIIEVLNLTAMEGYYKIMILWRPERMNTEAANKLLKILEEPYDGTLFILVTESPEKVLMTIRSRCRLVRIPPMATNALASLLSERFALDAQSALSFAAVSSGSYGAAVAAIEGDEDCGEYSQIFMTMLSCALDKDLYGILGCAERIAALSSRQKQRSFCITASQMIRKIYLISNGMSDMAAVPDAQAYLLERAAQHAGKDFCPRIMEHINRAAMLIERNVSAKVVFCDLADRFYAYI